MGKDLKKRKRDAKRKVIRQAFEQIAKVDESGALPPQVAIPQHLDGLNYQLIFDSYNHKECELDKLDAVSTSALVKKFALITRYNSKSIAGTTLLRGNIARDGNYKSLYDGLGKDIQIKEIQFAGTGRIFCYFVNDHPQNDRVCNYCCIVAVKKQHVKLR